MKKLARLGREIFDEAVADNLSGEAAKVAFYFFLSLFPLVLILFVLTGIVGGDAVFRWLTERLQAVVPGEASAFVERSVREIAERRRPGLLSFGILLTLWAASNIFAALADGLNTVYDRTEDRGWWKKRGIALGLLLVGAVLLVAGAAVLLVGIEAGESVGFGAVWRIARWPVAFALLLGLVWLVYYFLPNRDQRGAMGETLIGALVGTSLWVLATVLFRVYLRNFGTYGDTYGLVGAVIVLLLWLYLTSLTVLLGGEIAAVLEKRSRGTLAAPPGPGGRKREDRE